MNIYSWKTRASCGQPTNGLHFQFYITVLRYMGRVSVKQFVTNGNIKNMRFFLCTVYITCLRYIILVWDPRYIAGNAEEEENDKAVAWGVKLIDNL